MHDLTQTTPDIATKITTSTDSYIFTCPVCDGQARYAYSFDDAIEVFCDGQDFGTKAVVDGVVLEVLEASYLRICKDDVQSIPQDIALSLQSKGFIPEYQTPEVAEITE